MPKPSLKRSANGRPPGPGLAVRDTFSPARAWRPAIVARFARALGLAARSSSKSQQVQRSESPAPILNEVGKLVASNPLGTANVRNARAVPSPVVLLADYSDLASSDSGERYNKRVAA